MKPAVESEGRLQMWKIAIKPGKPLAFGRIGPEAQSGQTGSAAFIGLPGNPVSAFVTLAILVRPFILRAQGVTRSGRSRFRCAPISTGPSRIRGASICE